MGKTVDAAIGRIEAAEGLDKPGHMLGRAVSRTGQVAGRPGKRLANALHGHPYGRPIAVAIPIGTWTLAFGLDLLAATGLLIRTASLNDRYPSMGATYRRPRTGHSMVPPV